MALLQYRAGRRALVRLREQGFGPGMMRALLAPAAGPKWLSVVGLDQALIAGGFLSAPAGVTLLGASAGAWRSFALAAREPARVHRALCDDYIERRFTHADDAASISQAYRALLLRVFDDLDVAHALTHPQLSLGIVAARARGLTGSRARSLQTAALTGAALLNALSGHSQRLFFERTLFTNAGQAEMLAGLRGRRAALTADNARQVLLASGSVPLVMAPVRDVPAAPPGQYLDGGLTDYHVAQPIDCGPTGVAVLLLHQARVIPNWFDKWLPHRRAKPRWLQDVLLVHPSPAWLAALPGGRVPTREDFEAFVDAPEERIRRWRTAVGQSERLGEQLLSDVSAGRIPDLVRPL